MSDQPDTRDFERSFERPVAGRTPDEVWDEVLERMDLDASELEAAQERLRVAEPAPLDEPWIERTTAAVTRTGPARWRLSRRLLALAASFLGACLLLALAYALALPEKPSFSQRTYPDVLQLLQQENEEPSVYPAAIVFTFKHIKQGVKPLQLMALDPNAPQRLGAAARLGLQELRQSLRASETVSPGPVDDDPARVGAELTNSALTEEERLLLVRQLVSLAQAGIRAIKHAVVIDNLSAATQKSELSKLAELLAP